MIWIETVLLDSLHSTFLLCMFFSATIWQKYWHSSFQFINIWDVPNEPNKLFLFGKTQAAQSQHWVHLPHLSYSDKLWAFLCISHTNIGGFFKISLKLPKKSPCMAWPEQSLVSICFWLSQFIVEYPYIYIKLRFLSSAFTHWVFTKYSTLWNLLSPWLFHHMKFWGLLSISKPPILPEPISWLSSFSGHSKVSSPTPQEIFKRGPIW